MRLPKSTRDSVLPTKYHNMIYRAYHGVDMTGGRLSPVKDEFHPSNKEDDFLVAPPEQEWLPLNRPSSFREY